MGVMKMMGWQTERVEADPDIVLTDWAVMEVSLPAAGDVPVVTRHFIGVRSGWPPRAQVSSRIVRFDPGTARGVTESGRVYQLNGFSPVSAAVLATWARWKDMHRIRQDGNVSSEVVRDIFAAAGAFGRKP